MSRGGGKGPSLKDKLDGNELDLSLCDLNEAALPKATILDLSCNNLISLPSDFCSLMHLVKLDLSKNRLQQLPLDFGRLVNLQHLDLLNNRLVTLPVSFAQLKNLKWLDLKDNPLDPVLAKVAGDCLDEKQCKQAAVKLQRFTWEGAALFRAIPVEVLQHMKAIQSEQDRQRQRKLQAEREMEKKREAEQRAKEAQERELRKREKAEEKERRRREYDAQKAAKQEMEKKTKKENVQTRKPASSSRPPQPPRHKHSWSRSVLRVLLFVLLCVLCTLAACKLTELQHQPLCISVNTLYEDVLAALQNHKTLQNMLQQNSQQ
ncbi:leucine-rich repeat-containing protein 59 isoform X2 [Calonectris borealis]|uniref:leucine-rich repeat-containing protein 59 isoform X2 n=1 Tax=Calonectris borealis TaxID=1323832 RepID=UPI003F4C254D